MTAAGINADSYLEYPNYTAPRLNGEKLVDPNPRAILQSLSSTVASTAAQSSTFISGPLAELSCSARGRAVELAKEYTSSYRSLPNLTSDVSTQPILMSGHQPDLFHCGVWYKNFLLSELANKSGAIPVHFIVDNDLFRANGVRVPRLVNGQFQSEMIAFDRASAPCPWELRSLLDRSLWNSFANRVIEFTGNLIAAPLVQRMWSENLSVIDYSQPLGILLSQLRHLVEADLGLQTLEVPLSRLTTTNEFARFSLLLIDQLPKLHRSYNDELVRYRAAHHVRNHAQPLPDLAEFDGWLEAPWWVYSTQHPERQPLWVKRNSNGMRLSNRRDWEVAIDGDACSDRAVEEWLSIQSTGTLIRPRALITTMYARLLLSDCFIHGIGGAKYDQITDRIIESVWGFTPKPFIVATATMHLPLLSLPHGLSDPVDAELAIAVKQRHDIVSNPETILTVDDRLLSLPNLDRGLVQQLAENKQELLANMPVKGEKWEWHIAMKKIRQSLGAAVAESLHAMDARIETLKNLQQRQTQMRSREFSFCLFDQQTIQEQLFQLPD